MRHSIFPFGQILDGYSVPVLNERAVRAGAGILFFFALATFMHAWIEMNFAPTRLFIVAFLIDFSIRLFISPKYSPSLIAGQWLVRTQAPEYTGAAQKAFAWAIGFVLSAGMFYLMVLNQYMGSLNMLVCATCLTLMWFETSAGVCIGCKMYNFFAKDPAQLCPGNTCAYTPQQGAGGNWVQGLVVLAFLTSFIVIGQSFLADKTTSPTVATPATMLPPANAAEQTRCTVPEFAKKLGHEAMWKKHNNC